MSEETISNSPENQSVQIIKSRFTSLQSNLYGLILIVTDKAEKKETIDGIITTSSDIHNVKLDASWREFQDFIIGIKMSGSYNTNLSSNLNGELHKIFTDHKIATEFYTATGNYNNRKLNTILEDIINRVLGDKKPIIESLIQDVTRDEYTSTTNYKEAPPSSNFDLDNFTFPSAPKASKSHTITLSVQPILSPVRGKAVYELKIGDRIMVKIIPTTDQNRYIEMFALRQGSEILPIPADVVDIKAGKTRKDPIAITVRIAKDIFGYFSEEESHVRLKMYDPSADIIYRKIPASEVQSSVMPTILALFLLIIIVIFIIINI